MSSVSPLSGISPVGSSTSDSSNRGKYNQLQQGLVFKAKVAEAKSQTLFILDIAGQKIPARSANQLTVGQMLKLQVMTTTPEIHLKIINDSNNLFTGKSIQLLGDGIDIRSLFSSLQTSPQSPLQTISTFSQQTLESFFLFSQNHLSGKDGGMLLKKFIDQLGLSFEALLARGKAGDARQTLKAALLELMQVFKNADQLAEKTNKLLNTIEIYQLAQLQLDKDNIFIFPLPIPFLEKGYLLVEDHGGDDSTDNSTDHRFSLHLTLEGLGNLRIEILKSQEGIYLRFFSDSEEKMEFLKSFQENLLPDTIQSKILGVSFAQENLDTSADLLKKLRPEGESLVSFKV